MMIVFVGFLWILFVRTFRPEESTLQIGLEIRMDFRKPNLENVLISNDFSIIIFNRICCRSLHFSLLIPKGFQGVNGGVHGEMSEWFMVQLSKSCELRSSVGSNPTLSAISISSQVVYAACGLFFLSEAFQSGAQAIDHGFGRGEFGTVIQMSVDIGGGGEIAVSQPFLDLLHGYAVGKQQAGTTMAKIMETDVTQAVLFQ